MELWLLVAGFVAAGSVAILWYLRPRTASRADELRRYCIDRDDLLRRYADELRSRGLLAEHDDGDAFRP